VLLVHQQTTATNHLFEQEECFFGGKSLSIIENEEKL
jgi:hypothetical protein